MKFRRYDWILPALAAVAALVAGVTWILITLT
jgi:hypothetical protein